METQEQMRHFSCYPLLPFVTLVCYRVKSHCIYSVTLVTLLFRYKELIDIWMDGGRDRTGRNGGVLGSVEQCGISPTKSFVRLFTGNIYRDVCMLLLINDKPKTLVTHKGNKLEN